jgi:type VI secretion system protein ImpC
MSNPLQFSVEFGKPGPDQRPSRGQPLRFLYLTDLGDTCTSRKDTPLASRPIRPIDIDKFEDFLAAEEPSLDLPEGKIVLREMEDFHPDQLCETLPVFGTLMSLRDRLRVPGSFEKAAQDVQALLRTAPEAPSATDNVETDSDTMSRLLGQPSAPAPAGIAPEPRNFMNSLLQAAVKAHVTASADPRSEHYVQAVDSAITEQLRAVLHNPTLQSFEAAWRGLDLLVSNIETDEDMSIHVWNVGKSELMDALGPQGAPVDQSVLHRRIVDERGDTPFTVIVSDITFGTSSEDIRLLATLGALAGRSGGLVLASIAPQMIGAASWDAIATAPETLGAPDPDWDALRATPMARHIMGLAPGFMLRLPYGKRLDRVSKLAFEELDRPGGAHESFLWGPPALLAALLIARSFGQDRWNAQLNDNLAYDDLPLVPFEADGIAQMKPCAEVQFQDRVAQAILNAGPVPLVAVRNQNAVRLPWFQTVSSSGGSDRVGPFTT